MLTLGIVQTSLTSALTQPHLLASPKVLSFDNKKEKRVFLFVLFSLIG